MPEQFGLQILVNAGSPSAYWHFDTDDWELRDNAEEALADLADALETGYAAEHLRVVEISVISEWCGCYRTNPFGPYRRAECPVHGAVIASAEGDA